MSTAHLVINNAAKILYEISLGNESLDRQPPDELRMRQSCRNIAIRN